MHPNTREHKKRRIRFEDASFFFSGNRYDIDCAKFSAVLGIGFRLKRHLLPFFERAETFRLDCREVDKNIVPALIIGDETVPFTVIEPFYSSVHLFYLLSARSVNVRTDASRVMLFHAVFYYTLSFRTCQYPFGSFCLFF